MGTYTLDGVDLDDPSGRWSLDVKTGIRILPARRTSSPQLPGRDGLPPSLGATFEPGAVKLTIEVGGGSHAAMMQNLGFINGVLGQRHKLLNLDHDYGDGTTVRAGIEVTSSAEPELITDSLALVSAIATIPGVFWRSVATADATLQVTAASATSVIGSLAGSSGPVQDALIRVKGGLSGIVLSDPVSGDQVTVTMALAASEYLIIDCATWTARKVTTNTWAGGTDVSQYVVSNRGTGPMLSMVPDFTTGVGRIRLTVKGTNPASAPIVTVRARTSHL